MIKYKNGKKIPLIKNIQKYKESETERIYINLVVIVFIFPLISNRCYSRAVANGDALLKNPSRSTKTLLHILQKKKKSIFALNVQLLIGEMFEL